MALSGHSLIISRLCLILERNSTGTPDEAAATAAAADNRQVMIDAGRDPVELDAELDEIKNNLDTPTPPKPEPATEPPPVE